MEIHKISENSIGLKFSEGVVVVNPQGKGKKSLNPSVMLTTYSTPIAGCSFETKLEEGQKIFTGAGEYEKDNLIIQGYSFGIEVNGSNVLTNSWNVKGEGINVSILGDVSEKKEIQSFIADTAVSDVLIVFSNEKSKLDASKLTSIAASLQVRYIVPIGKGGKLIENIAKEVGNSEEVTGKFVFKKKDLQEGKVKAVIIQ